MVRPALSKDPTVNRMTWAKRHMDFGEKWKDVIFSDEKMFNLDGPDGFQYYWHDLQKEKQVRMSRNFGAGTVTIWGALPLAWISTRMNSESSIDMLEISLIEISLAAIHNSRLAKEWFLTKNIDVLDWPARSPNLNPIENLWGILARKVYVNGKPYQTALELKNAIRLAWLEIPEEILKNLVKSM